MDTSNCSHSMFQHHACWRNCWWCCAGRLFGNGWFGTNILVAGCKEGLLHTRLNLVSLDDYAKVAQSKKISVYLKKWHLKLFTIKKPVQIGLFGQYILSLQQYIPSAWFRAWLSSNQLLQLHGLKQLMWTLTSYSLFSNGEVLPLCKLAVLDLIIRICFVAQTKWLRHSLMLPHKVMRKPLKISLDLQSLS